MLILQTMIATQEPKTNIKEERLIEALKMKLRELREKGISGELFARAELTRGGITKSSVGVTEALY